MAEFALAQLTLGAPSLLDAVKYVVDVFKTCKGRNTLLAKAVKCASPPVAALGWLSADCAVLGGARHRLALYP